MPIGDAPGLWRNGAFLRVWSAATISIFGSLVTRLALPFAAILLLGAGAAEMAGIRAAEAAAALAVGLVAGAWVDRLRRRPVLVAADVGRAVLLGSIPIAALGGWLTLGHLVVVACLAAMLTAFFDAADVAYLPSIVRRDQLVAANRALAASGSAAELTAFGLSGALVQLLGAPLAIAIDAASFVASALLLGSIRRLEPPPPPVADRESLVREIREGLALVGRDPILRALAWAAVCRAVLWGIFGTIYVLYAMRELALVPAAIGLVAGVGGAASLVGALASGRVLRRLGVGRATALMLVIAAAGNLLIPLAPSGAPLLAAACLVVQQLGDGAETIFSVADLSLRQALVRDGALGRVNATVRVASGVAELVAIVVTGAAAEIVGLRATAFVGPAALLVAAVVLWRSPLRALRTIPDGVGSSDLAPVADVGRSEG